MKTVKREGCERDERTLFACYCRALVRSDVESININFKVAY